MALLATIGAAHSASMCMLQVPKHQSSNKKSTQEIQSIVSSLKKDGPRPNISRLYAQEPLVVSGDNCFLVLSPDVRGGIYKLLVPSHMKSPFSSVTPEHIKYKNPLLEERIIMSRKFLFVADRLILSTVCKSCRSMVTREDEEVASYLRDRHLARSLACVYPRGNDAQQAGGALAASQGSNEYCSIQ